MGLCGKMFPHKLLLVRIGTPQELCDKNNTLLQNHYTQVILDPTRILVWGMYVCFLLLFCCCFCLLLFFSEGRKERIKVGGRRKNSHDILFRFQLHGPFIPQPLFHRCYVVAGCIKDDCPIS